MSAHERATQIIVFLNLNCLFYRLLYSCLNRVYSLFILLFVCTMPLYQKITTVNCCGICDRAKRLAFFTYAIGHLTFTFCAFKKSSPNSKMNLFGKLIGGIKIKQFSTQTLRSVGKLMLVRQSC